MPRTGVREKSLPPRPRLIVGRLHRDWPCRYSRAAVAPYFPVDRGPVTVRPQGDGTVRIPAFPSRVYPASLFIGRHPCLSSSPDSVKTPVVQVIHRPPLTTAVNNLFPFVYDSEHKKLVVAISHDGLPFGTLEPSPLSSRFAGRCARNAASHHRRCCTSIWHGGGWAAQTIQ